uniref:SFRICE_023653 n=1 Tax=Spodoptera frugiperda TaxID=7108 RepID=A0A2H1W0R5_SPOFR
MAPKLMTKSTQSESIGCASNKGHTIGADRLRERERARDRSRSATRARKSTRSEPIGYTGEKEHAIGADQLHFNRKTVEIGSCVLEL